MRTHDPNGTLSVSVVINTLDRADSLADTLRACTQLTHPDFEVVVVCGPSSDHTDGVLDEWDGKLKRRDCPEANLSMSRNIGIAAASGDVVAFIDDDGVPEPTWLDELCAGYDTDEVGAVGGVVYDHTGCSFQTRMLLSDRLGNTTLHDELPPGDFSFPGSSRYPSMLGCNSSFLRSALVAVGGFDEQYDYYLDETDVCLRMVDAGWLIRSLPGAPVHHKYLPSAIRTRAKVVTDFHAVVKNKVYFSIVNGTDHWSFTDVMGDDVRFAASHREEGHRNRQAQVIDDDGYAQVLSTIDSGWVAGLRDGLRGRVRLLDPDALEHGPLVRFPTVAAPGRRLRLVFVTRTLPPAQPGGVGRFMLDLARELVGRGHEVRLVTTGGSHAQVDLEHGVWIHRVPKTARDAPPTHIAPVPQMLWDNAGPVADEVLRISSERPVDLVFASIWDVEWAGVHARSSLPVVCGYTTPFSVVRATQPHSIGTDDTTADAIEALERWAHHAAHAVQANGHHIVEAVETSSGVRLDRSALFVAPLGTPDPTARSDATSWRPASGTADDGTSVVFVGRLEPRKGADLLLDAVPEILRSDHDVTVTLVGDDALADRDGSTLRARFEALHPDAAGSGRVRFLGPLPVDRLDEVWGTADIAVLPSRFESFGLVYVEAMARSLPVIAVSGSGADEVVEDGVTGLLCAPDPVALARAVHELVADAPRRTAMGAAGRARFESAFDTAAMADRFLEVFDRVRALRPGRDWSIDPGDTLEMTDGFTGQLLDVGDTVELDLHGGRPTVVLVGHGSQSVVEVAAGGHGATSRRVALQPGEFHHVHLPASASAVRVHVLGPGHAVLAAVIVTNPGGEPVDARRADAPA